MSWSRFLVLPLLAGVTLFAAGALTPQPSPTESLFLPPPVFPVRADPAAAQVLQEAIAALAPDRLRWIKTELWQQASVPPLTFQARGLYLGGPDNRLRLDLQVQQDTARSRLLIVSDGRTLWQAQQIAGQDRAVSRLDLAKVLSALRRPDTSPQRREDFFRRQFFLGLTPLLHDLQAALIFTRRQAARWRDREVILLTGVWSAPPPEWPISFPRQCRLFLDARTRWPHRLEWWGPLPKRNGCDCLLLQMEFRNPVVGRPLSEAQFHFQPGRSQVTDLTAEWATR